MVYAYHWIISHSLAQPLQTDEQNPLYDENVTDFQGHFPLAVHCVSFSCVFHSIIGYIQDCSQNIHPKESLSVV